MILKPTELGLKIEKPDDALYLQIKAIYNDMASDLQLSTPYIPAALAGAGANVAYSYNRSLIESVSGGAHAFVSEGTISKQQINVPPGIPQTAIHDNRTFEGWRHAVA